MTVADRPSPALKGDLMPISPSPSRAAVAAPPSCWRRPLLVTLIGLLERVQRERRRLRRADDDAAVRSRTRDDAAVNTGSVNAPAVDDPAIGGTAVHHAAATGARPIHDRARWATRPGPLGAAHRGRP